MRVGLGKAIGLAATAAALAAAVPGTAADPCAPLAIPELAVCKPVGNGVVLATTEAEADAAAAAALHGQRRFETHFGPAARFAVVVGNGPAGLRDRLAAAGYPIVLPWLNPAARHKGLRSEEHTSELQS